MAVVVDFTKQKNVTTFSGSSAEDVSYATNFWQSIQLHPPMESRLVSSDIKQRLKVAPPSSQVRNVAHSTKDDNPTALKDFMSRARFMEHMHEYARMQKFAEAKAEDKALLTKHREIRKKKEEISQKRGVRPITKAEEERFLMISSKKEEYEADMEDEDALKLIDDFEAEKIGVQDSDSD